MPGRSGTGLEGDEGSAGAAGSVGLNSGSTRTVQVNQSSGPLPEGREPARMISMAMILVSLATMAADGAAVVQGDS